jgi:DNA-binding response OmpR family regulator
MRIAVADDEETIRDFTANLLRESGYVCALFNDGKALVTGLQRDTFDLVIVDWSMPGLTGLEVIQWARSSLTPCPPFIMLTSRLDKDDIVAGLAAGADDYIVKPEAPQVILARVEAVLRRVAPTENPVRLETFGAYCFDKMTETVRLNGQDITLTSREFGLALLLFRHTNRAFSRAYILETLWNSVGDLPTRTLDMHISRIRSKLGLSPENGYRLQTVFGYGYRLETYGQEG